MSYASAKDKNPRSGNVIFYGELIDILQIIYSNDMKFVLFKCDWVDNKMGMRMDEFKFTMLNFNHLLYRSNNVGDEPFILATQAKQAFYVKDPLDPNWYVAMKMTPRDIFDNISANDVPQAEALQRQQLSESIFVPNTDYDWVRRGVNGTTLEVNNMDNV
jgi:hypothetical protein